MPIWDDQIRTEKTGLNLLVFKVLGADSGDDSLSRETHEAGDLQSRLVSDP